MICLATIPYPLFLFLVLGGILAAVLALGLFIRSLIRRHPQAIWSMTSLLCLLLEVLLFSGVISHGGGAIL